MSAASGAVGSVVGQLAKAKGCRAIGFAGGPDKCRYVTDELGFDACIDYKAHADPKALYGALKAATPDGIDGHFENVGGAVLDAVLLRMNDFGRIALCGMISGYDGEPIPIRYPALILTSRLRVEGFIVSEHMDAWPAGAYRVRSDGRHRQAEVSRNDRQRPRRRAGRVLRNVEGEELREATCEALTCSRSPTFKL